MKIKTTALLQSLIIIVFIISICFYAINLGGQENDYPEIAIRAKFKKVGEDTLRLIKEIKMYDGSETAVGNVTGLEVLGNNIYISDRKYNKVFVINKENFTYQFTINDIEWQLPEIYNRFPYSPMTYGGNILVPQYATNPLLLSVFSPDGKFIKHLKAKGKTNWGYSGNPQGCFIKDSTIYVIKNMADGFTKVELLKITDSLATRIKGIVPVEDFEVKTDSAALVKKT